MKGPDYTITLTVDSTPHESFNHINSISEWWTRNLKGDSKKLNDEFTVQFGDMHLSTQKLIELVPDKKVVWLVTDSTLSFLEDKSEWTNTTIRFEITSDNHKTQIHFTHIGLVPQAECYKDCVKGWDYYLKGSLFKLLTEGKGAPELK